MSFPSLARASSLLFAGAAVAALTAGPAAAQYNPYCQYPYYNAFYCQYYSQYYSQYYPNYDYPWYGWGYSPFATAPFGFGFGFAFDNDFRRRERERAEPFREERRERLGRTAPHPRQFYAGVARPAPQVAAPTARVWQAPHAAGGAFSGSSGGGSAPAHAGGGSPAGTTSPHWR